MEVILRGALFVFVLLTASCATLPKPEDRASKEDWMKAVIEYRRDYNDHPSDYEVKMKLDEAELNASEAYYEDGMSLKEQGFLDDAIYQFQEALTAMPNNEKVANALKNALKEKVANTYYRQAQDLYKAGKTDDAKNLLSQVLTAVPDHAGAKALMDKIENEGASKVSGLSLSSKEPISLNFDNTDLRTAFHFIGRAFGINIIFDDSVKGQEVTLKAENVTFEQALELILHTTQTFYKQIGTNTILISEDSKAKRDQYDDLIIKTVQLNSIKAADMANILKSSLDLKHVVVNESLNTLMIRDTKDVLDLADKVIAVNDRPPAEVLLDVEILEVNRNREEQLGLNYGQQLVYNWSQSPMPITSGLGSTDFASLLGQGSLTLPAVTFNYFKQDVNAKTLAHPQIRTLDNKEANIHIGDRVPLPATVIQQTTGQVQTTYNYTDIGVLLNVIPIVNLDRTIVVKLKLEVSSLGANLGTPQNPAFDIGTRSADTTMLLHDGESAVLGGLIQDQERNTYVKLPVVGDIPIIGRLLGNSSDENGVRTDILLTITPRIVRDWDFARKDLQEVYSGTNENLSSEPLFAAFKMRATGAPLPKIAVGEAEADTANAVSSEGTTLSPVTNGTTAFAFSMPQYEAAVGEPVTVALYGHNLGNVRQLPLAVAYNGSNLNFVSAIPQTVVANMDANPDDKHGLVRLNLSLQGGAPPTGWVHLADLALNGYAPGISYLVFLNPSFKDENGTQVRTQARASRIVIK